MLVGVTGDTHNNLKNISKICDLFNKANPSLVVHTGDITLPKSLAAFSKLNMPLIGVFGNNDELEKKGLIEVAKKFDCNFFDEPYKIEIGEKKHTEIKDSTLVLLSKGENLKVSAKINAKFLVISGKPINEEIARGGPFVMNTKSEILQAVQDYHNGNFVK